MKTIDASENQLAVGLTDQGLADFDLAIVLGSGLGSFADCLEGGHSVAFEDVQGMPCSAVPGHAGRFVLGNIGATRVLVQQGRVHLYEGRSPAEVTASVRAFARLGCGALLLTNAAGGLVPQWPLPCLMRVSDHINMQGCTPLRGTERAHGSPYHSEMGLALQAAAEAAGVTLQAGVYLGLTGPSYETPAEIRAFAGAGVQAVGMSTVAEAAAAHAAGLPVAAVACITNLAAGLAPGPLSHAEVVTAGAAIANEAGRLLVEAAPRLIQALRPNS